MLTSCLSEEALGKHDWQYLRHDEQTEHTPGYTFYICRLCGLKCMVKDRPERARKKD
jgi:DNA-directed RNA polymerase subunit RPC12/RpoP